MSPYPIELTRSIIINASSKKAWTTLETFGGNEKFNPSVTSSTVDGHGIGSKRVCYVTLDGDKTVIGTIKTLISLNEVFVVRTSYRYQKSTTSEWANKYHSLVNQLAFRHTKH